MAEQDSITELLSGLLGGESNGGDIDPEMLLKILDIVSKLGESDINTEFLRALRPLLREENRQKLDRASTLLKLLNIIPVLRGSGLFGGM